MADSLAVWSVATEITAADNARDLTRVLACYHDGAMLLPPNEPPVMGRAAIRQRYEGLFRSFDPAIEARVDELMVTGDWAYVRGHNGGWLRGRADVPDRPLNDVYLMILHRGSGGWRITRLIWHGAGTTPVPASPSVQDHAPDSTMVVIQDLAWAADGQRLFFSAMRVKPDYSDYTPEKWAVYRYDLRGGTVLRIVAAAFSVAAAPREPLLIVGKRVGGNRDLYVVDDDGREIQRLTTDSTEDFGAAWSPDGHRIAFTSKRGGRSEVYVADRDGAHPRRLIDAGTDRTLNPAWSPDGRLLAYYRERGDGQDQIFVSPVDGSSAVNVTNDAYNNVYPGWTPDGRVVYGRSKKGSPTIAAFTVRPDGSDKRPLLSLPSFFARFSPDGSRIAYLDEPANAAGVRLVVATGDGRVLAVAPLERVGEEP